MSIELMSHVWKKTEVKGSELLVLLALADHANDDGVCWPSIPRLAERARISERQTQRIITRLSNAGFIEIITKGNGQGNSTIYRLNLKGDIAMSPLDEKKDDKMSPIKQKKGDIAMSPLETAKGDICDTKGDICDTKGDIAMSPESSIEPPIEPPQQQDGSCRSRLGDSDYGELCRQYENEIGLLSPMIADELSALLEENPKDWVMDAFRASVVQNVRKMSYVKSVLNNWRTNGRKDAKLGGHTNGHANGYVNGATTVALRVMEEDE